MSLGWKFPKLDGGPKQGINDGGVSTFTGSKLYDSLAREICQNSLDAMKDGEKNVRVEFKEKSIRINDYDVLKELKKVFFDVEDYTKDSDNSKLESFLNEANKVLSSDLINFMVINDYHTTGLDGAKEVDKDTPWLALTHSNGISVKGSGSQGSYGIGKNAPFACSTLRTVFYYSLCDKDNLEAFTGVTKLVTHKDEDDNLTIGTGYYENIETRMPIFEEDECKFRDIFSRKDDSGTAVIIAGFKKSDTWKEDIEKAIIRNYFVSIIKGLLTVEIEDVILNNTTIKERIDYYKKQEVSGTENSFGLTSEFYETYMDPTERRNGKIITQNDVELYVRLDDNYSKMIAEMRSTCMLVKARKQNRFARYAAIVIVKDGILNEMLKTIEPSTHDEWDPEIEEDKSKQIKVRNAKNKLYKWIRDTLDDICKGEDSEEFDLDGISAYLGFDDDADLKGNDSEMVNLFDSDSKIGDDIRRKKQIVNRKKPVAAIKTKGIRNDSFVQVNNSSGGNRKGSAGTENQEGDDNVTTQKDGNKVINKPAKVENQRIVSMPSDGVYKVVFSTENDCDNVTISLKAATDDGNYEDLSIMKYKIDNNTIEVNDSFVIIHNIKAHKKNEIFLYPKYDERMTIILSIQ